ncbi:MAG: 6,7-dimethyl-8-ribityllumazine synthase [Deltaproteobacteria bacterium]|nr:6,7-dimethyl-8-ribityllumazine synthase [Deltaproteobacteria bacterium]
MATRFLIIISRFNDTITKSLLSGAQDTLQDAGIDQSHVDILWVPGAFELATVAAQAARSKTYAAIICLGAVIRGDTPHFDLVAGQAAAGLQRVGIDTGVPVIFGVITTDTVEQALTRSGIKGGNKGVDAAQSALSMVKTMGRLAELARR